MLSSFVFFLLTESASGWRTLEPLRRVVAVLQGRALSQRRRLLAREDLGQLELPHDLRAAEM